MTSGRFGLESPAMLDANVRLQAFGWLRNQVAIHGDVLPRDILAKGFYLQEKRVPLLGPQGIFKPAVLTEVPLSITTAPDGPYEDSFGPDDCLRYQYRGRDPRHRDNVGLRLAMQRQVPLVYFHGVVPGRYLAVWPVFVVGDDPESLTFRVTADDTRLAEEAADRVGRGANLAMDTATYGRRAYITAEVRKRLHQRGFRERVLRAYRDQCAFCRLRHRELLDAAHIIPDSDPGGLPLISNGIAMCKIHHAAYDGLIIFISLVVGSSCLPLPRKGFRLHPQVSCASRFVNPISPGKRRFYCHPLISCAGLRRLSPLAG